MSQLATIDRRAATWGVLAVLGALAVAVLGSGNLRWFDAALVINRLAGIPYPVWSPRPAVS